MIKLDRGRMQQGAVSITLDATGDLSGTVQVTFPQSFDVIPKVMVIAPYGTTQENYGGATVTTTSFYVSVTTETISTYKSQTFPVGWTAVEPA